MMDSYTDVKVSIVTGRDQEARTKRRIALMHDGSPWVEVHPWTEVHPTDGVRAFQTLLANAAGKHVIIVTFLPWVVETLGAMVEGGRLSASNVSIYIEEDGTSRKFGFNSEGCLSDGWPFGYFYAAGLEE